MSYIEKNELFLSVRNLNLFIHFLIIKYLFSLCYMQGTVPDSRDLQEWVKLNSYLPEDYPLKERQVY